MGERWPRLVGRICATSPAACDPVALLQVDPGDKVYSDHVQQGGKLPKLEGSGRRSTRQRACGSCSGKNTAKTPNTMGYFIVGCGGKSTSILEKVGRQLRRAVAN